MLIIDPKMVEEDFQKAMVEIKKVTDKPVVYAVNTHSDGDRVRGNRYLPETAPIEGACRYPGRERN